MKGLRQLLSAVSRSFYLSMRFLPREMRPGVAVGYLLARATDTVADTVDMDCRERLALLRMMGATVAGDASREAAASCFGRLGILSTVQTHRGRRSCWPVFQNAWRCWKPFLPVSRCS
ncbi:squalene/phytoene synthase family protein [Akkermansia massiliensis]